MRLSVKLNNLFGDEVPPDAVERVAAAGADAVGYRPWYGDGVAGIAAAARDHGLDLAYLSGGSAHTDGPGFPLTDPGRREDAIEELGAMIDLAADLGCATVNVIPGREQAGIDRASQRAGIVDALRAVAPAAERTGVEVVLEPLNTAVDHPGYYLVTSGEAYGITHAVDSPAVSVLFDVYHQQITEGNVIENLTTHVEEIGHVHVADVPGRHQPGTGELSYGRILEALADAGYDGYVECEFVPTGPPEDAVETVAGLLP